MLVEDGAAEVLAFPVERGAGAGHRASEGDALRCRHAAEEHRHGEGGGLRVADAAISQPGDEAFDGLGRQLRAVAFGADRLLREKSAHDFGSDSIWRIRASRRRLAPMRNRAGVAQ